MDAGGYFKAAQMANQKINTLSKAIKEELMPSGREKDRKLRRRRRRQKKLRKFKTRLENTKDLDKRLFLIEKIKKISIYEPEDLPEK
jgi:hypothetical protein